MDEICKIALVILVPAILAMTGKMWRMAARIEYLEDTLGKDSKSGLRGTAHKRKGQIAMLAQQVDLLRDKVGMRALDLAEAFRQDDG